MAKIVNMAKIDRIGTTKAEPGRICICMTCGAKNLNVVNPTTTYYAPLRKGEGGLAVPHGQFPDHYCENGSLCVASEREVGRTNLAAIAARRK